MTFFTASYIDFIHLDDRETTIREAANLAGGLDTISFENRYRCKDGSYRWLSWRAKSLFPQQLIYAAARDITERKEAEAALRKAVADLKESHEELKASQMLLINAAKLETAGQLAAGVAHEVKNPLAILMLSLDYLSVALPDVDGTVANLLKDMRDAIQRADTIVRGLLDFSASEKLELQPDDLSSVIEHAFLLVKHSRTLNHIRLENNLAPNLPPVAIDRNKAVQAFVNLFTNSIDAMPDGGALAVRTYFKPLSNTEWDPGSRTVEQFRADDLVVVVEIEDSGSGIPPDKLSRIFDPFFTTKAPGKGTGMGLTVTQNIIHLHGGSLEITNRQEGGVRSVLRFHALNARIEEMGLDGGRGGRE